MWLFEDFFLPVIQIRQLNEENNSATTNCIVFLNFELGNAFNKQKGEPLD